MKVDKKLYEWATVRQAEYLDAVEKYGSQRQAAKALSVSFNSVNEAVSLVKKKAAKHGYSPKHDLVHPVAPGQLLRGASTLYKEGKPVIQWVKTSADQAWQEELMRATVAAMAEDVRGMAPLTQAPDHISQDILVVFPFGDPHVGLHVWAKECGEAFDLEIGRKLTLGAVDRLMQSAPSADTAILLLLGDVFHMNDQTNQTPAHKHQLDVDSRFVKVLQVGIETYRHAALRALQKYNRVVMKLIPGNHDPQAIWALAFTLAAYFHNEPRIEVDLGPSKFWYYRFGKVLLGSTHGDTVKHEQLGAIMACDRAEDWGQTKHRYWLTGHVHSKNVKEFPGVICESFRTLAAADSYAAGHGYRAGRDMTCIVYHKTDGEIERHRCDIGMLEAA
jgi:hypothetical protein